MKKIFMTLAAVGLVLASCSKDEKEDFNSQSPDVIKFASATSRASISDLAALRGAAAGFTVYGTSGTAPSAWYAGVEGTNYVYDPSWRWAGTPAEWPLTAAGYPMAFYAMYPVGAAGVTITATAPSTINGVVTIEPTAATQLDLLAAKATTDAKPSDGTLPLTFNHILSKVNFGIIAGDATNVFVQYTGIKTLKPTATYNYVAGTWGSASGNNTGYNYYSDEAVSSAPGVTPKATFNLTGNVSEDPKPFYTAPHSNHLMLLPQTSTAWAPSHDDFPTADESYIALTYRLFNAGGEIGYGSAMNYLVDNDEYDDLSGWSIYTGINYGSKPYGSKPLFIKVGFPVAADWTPGKGYTYNVCLGTLGSTNGYYLDDTYYDEDGYDTGIPVKGKKPGDPVTDGTINFRVDVTTWDDEAAIDLSF